MNPTFTNSTQIPQPAELPAWGVWIPRYGWLRAEVPLSGGNKLPVQFSDRALAVGTARRIGRYARAEPIDVSLAMLEQDLLKNDVLPFMMLLKEYRYNLWRTCKIYFGQR